MQKRLWLGVLLVGFPTACMLGSGCSSSSSDGSSSTPDAANDVTHVVDTGPDVIQIVDAARCDDANLNTISLPDASLGDAGATTSTCTACLKTTCSSELNACNGSCTCKNDIDDALACAAAAGGLDTSCLSKVDLSDPNAKNLGECIYLACTDECGLGGFVVTDAGVDAD